MATKRNYYSQIQTVYKDVWKDKDKFDNSDYPEDNKFYEKTNKKVIGRFKDEAAGFVIKDFVGLRCKTYLYIKDNNENKDIKHEDYKNTVFNDEQIYHIKKMRSDHQQNGICLLSSTNVVPRKTETENIQFTTVMRNLKFWEKR